MIGFDVGGTFTDVVAVQDGAIKTVKVPTDVRETERGVLRGAAEIGASQSQIFNHASTHGGRDGAAGAVWLFDKDAFDVAAERDLLDLDDTVYASATPIAGVLDPDTHVRDTENGRAFFCASNPVWRTKPGAIFRYLTNGGGGWGDPYARDPERVKESVRDGYLSIEGAKRDYGVVVVGDPEHDPEGLRVDADATAQLGGAA